MYFDHVSKPAAGRYFPYSKAELAHRVLGLNPRWGTAPKAQRIDLHLKNSLVECRHGHQLCTFKPSDYLASFSLPDSVATPLARRAIDSAIEQFAQIERGPSPSLSQRYFVVYRAFLGALGELCISQHRINGQGIPWTHADRVLMLHQRHIACEGQLVVFRTRLV